MANPATSDLDVAIVGMAGRFPGARSVDEFWRNVRDGVESIRTFTVDELLAAGVDRRTLDDPKYVRASSMLADAELFDAALFEYSPREAELMDPQSRIFLEVAWEAFEDAGFDPRRSDARVGVFAGQSIGTYLLHNLRHRLTSREFILTAANIRTILGNGPDFLTTRVAYKLGLNGPAVALATACSTSLVAVHLACQSLLNGECDLALAGAASVYLPQEAGYLYEDGALLTPDGHCRPFDARASGTLFGRGAGAVVLKPLEAALEDGDRVLAVIKGSAVNNDGALRAGFTAPGVTGQSRVVAEAMALAGVSADSIGLVEAHGTGTRQGDPIEISALTQAYRASTQRRGFCAIGSVKSNFGHLDAAAGMAGLIKTVMALRHGALPPSLNFESPNPQIDFASSPFYVNTSLRQWPRGDGPRRAGVSSFGLGGTNAHVVLEEAPAREPSEPDERGVEVLVLSAKTEGALAELAGRYEPVVEGLSGADLTDACWTANTGRAQLKQRLAVVGASGAELARALGAHRRGEPWPGLVSGHGDGAGKVAFLCTGQGPQYVGMGRELYRTLPVFRDAIDRCAAAVEGALPEPLLEVMHPGAGREDWATERLSQTLYTQPALFAVEWSLAQLWRWLGVEPDVVLGHSSGEFVAAALAGVFSAEDGMRLSLERGRLMQRTPVGEMMAVRAGEGVVSAEVMAEAGRGGQVSVAAVNGPENVVVSGEGGAVRRVAARLEEKGIETKTLAVKVGGHSPLMDGVLAEFEAAAGRVAHGAPELEVVSNVTGEVMRAGEWGGAYWRRHMREPVRFAAGMAKARALGCTVFVEVGPRPVLLGMGQLTVSEEGTQWLPSLRPERGEWTQLLESAAAYWASGREVDWGALEQGRRRNKVALPTYPFQRQRFWIEEERGAGLAAAVEAPGAHPLLGARVAAAIPLFQGSIALARETYLADHALAGTTVLPGTGLLELAVATGRELFPDHDFTVDDLLFERPLVLGAEPTAVQVVARREGPGTTTFEIFSRAGAADEWTRHASGALAKGGRRAGAASALEAQADVRADVRNDALADARRRADAEVSVPAFYDAVQGCGIELGPSFRGIRRLWRGPRTALAEIEIPDALRAGADAYHLHPALLDAAVQAVLAAARDVAALAADGVAWVPTALERLRVHARTTETAGPLWSHVEITSDEDPGVIVGNVRLMGSAAEPIAELTGWRLARVRASDVTGAGLGDVWYGTRWQPAPLAADVGAAAGASGPVEPGALAARLRASLPDLEQRYGLGVYRALEPELDALCAGWVAVALRELGWTPELGERVVPAKLAPELGVIERHRRMFDRMLDMLADDGLLRRDAGAFVVARALEPPAGLAELGARLLRTHPAARAELTLVNRCGPALARVLKGLENPLDLLFPGGGLEDLEALYQNAPFTRAYNDVVREAFRAAVAARPAGAPVRVLEIGAGTGGTAAWVLPELPANRTEYVFTDLSHLFLGRAAEKFGDFPFVEYRLFDVERPPQAQGIPTGEFDVVLATQVLHATKDLRRTLEHVAATLAPGGLVVVVEGLEPQRWVDLVFGLTEGWWRFTDAQLRSAHPLLPASAWTELLAEVGLEGAAVVAGDAGDDPLFHQAVVLARAPLGRGAAAAPRWLVLADRGGVADALIPRLEAAGAACVRVLPAGRFQRSDERTFSVDPTRAEDFKAVLEAAPATPDVGGATWAGVVHLWSLDGGWDESGSAAELSAAQDRGARSALNLVVGSLGAALDAPPRLLFATRNAQAALPGDPVDGVVHSTLWGLGRAVANEHPELRCTLVDLDRAAPADAAAFLARELTADDRELQVALRGGERRVARVVRVPAPGSGASADRRAAAGPTRLAVSRRGTLENLRYEPLARRPPGSGEIEIRVAATGLNFRDVLNALGLYPGDPGPLGRECSGVVVRVGAGVDRLRVGDAVIALSPGSFGSYAIARAELAIKKPERMTHVEGATIIGAFLTAHYALDELARLGPSDTVLVHAGAGGVGMAAIQLALRAGARVFATAGRPEKRALLESLGVAAVMDSRALDFAREARERTGDRGVDVVLNSLTGEAIEKSLEALAENGRFIELGKVDVWGEERVRQARPDVDYRVVDLEAVTHGQPELAARLLREIEAGLAEGSIDPLPATVFARDEATEAFRWMAQARHVGKVVITQDGARPGLESEDVPRVRSAASYLVAGGLGGIGLLVARWLAEQGAESIVLMGRRAPSENARAVFEELSALGATVTVELGDVAEPADLARVLARLDAELPPLRGVVQCAGALDDGVLLGQDWTRFRTVLAPKMAGTWNLHRATLGRELDFFSIFSSFAGVLGLRGQSNHAAACAFQDALAHHRAARGLPAQAIDWGAWSGVGAAVDRDVIERLGAQGILTITPEEGLEAFQRALEADGGLPQVGVTRMDWPVFIRQYGAGRTPSVLEELAHAEPTPEREARPTDGRGRIGEALAKAPPRQRRALLLDHVRACAARVLGAAPDSLDDRQPLGERGLDSLMAVELRGVLGRDLPLQRTLPATLLFDYPTVDGLAGFLARALGGEDETTTETTTAQSQGERAALVSEVSELTEEEAELELLRELDSTSETIG